MEGEEWMLLVCSFAFWYRGRRDNKEFLSCFNAFSRVDIRVDVKIPGGVNAYMIDLRGER